MPHALIVDDDVDAATSLRLLLESTREATRNEKTNSFLGNLRRELGKQAGLMNPEREQIERRYASMRHPANLDRVARAAGAKPPKGERFFANLHAEMHRPKLMDSYVESPGEPSASQADGSDAEQAV